MLSNEETGFFECHLKSAPRELGYLGVGFLQNLTYISRCFPAYAIIVDISFETLQKLQIILDKIKRSANQKDFLKWWKEQKDTSFNRYLKLVEGNPGWLTDVKLYKSIRRLIVDDNIYLIHGDIADIKTHDSVKEISTVFGKPIGIIYLSNILSIHGVFRGRSFDYSGSKRFFNMNAFSPEARYCMTFEFMPDEYKMGFYHYSTGSLYNIRNLLKKNKTTEEFLADYLALIILTKSRGFSDFLEPVNLDLFKKKISTQKIDQLIQTSPDWLVWQNFRDHFFMKRR